MSEPREISEELRPRVSVATAARYIGRTTRWVQLEIKARRIPAIDTSAPGSKKPCWSIANSDLRSVLAKFALHAELRLREAERVAAEEHAKDAKDAKDANAARKFPARSSAARKIAPKSSA